jgi:hypothetical protein
MVNAHELIYFTNQQKTTPQYICFTFNEGDDEESTLYIKKWRVPDEIPHTIRVTVLSNDDIIKESILKKEEAILFPNRKPEIINFVLNHISNHKHTIRYDPPFGDTGVNSLYVPRSVFRDGVIPEKIRAVIQWE